MGNGVKFRERACAFLRESSGNGDGIGRGRRMLAGGSPGGLQATRAGPSGARGRNAISAVWSVRNRASVAYASDTL